MKPIIALDIETTGLSPWTDQIHMCGLWDGERYVACRSAVALKWELGNSYPDHDIVGHNTQFDIKFLQVQEWLDPENLKMRVVHDTKIIGSLLRERLPKVFLDQYEEHRKEINKSLPRGVSHREGSPLSLKTMAPWYLKVPPFWETPGDHDNEEYNQKDCMYTYRLFKLLAPRLQTEISWDFYERMLSWSKMVREMEIRGIRIGLDTLESIEREYTQKRMEMKSKLDGMWAPAHAAYLKNQVNELSMTYEAMKTRTMLRAKDKQKCELRYNALLYAAIEKLNKQINYASPAQMSWLLKEYLGLDIVNADGEESTGKAVLNRLAQDREDIKTYLDWREADKVLTMYVPTYRELQVDSIVHPSFNLTGTRTGRTSSSGPNLQQVPSKLYRLFKPSPGSKFIQYDLSGIEAALIALYSGDKTLFKILEKGESIHDHNAKAMFNLECEVNLVSSLHPKERKVVKNIGFACFYGAGWRRISQVFAAGGFHISDQEAKEKLKLLKSYYPEVFEFHKEITEVFETGQTVKNLFGRPITLQAHDNPYMQGFNTLIQSSASDLNLYACEKYWRQGGNPILLVHDFILAEEPADAAEEMAAKLRAAMTDFALQSDSGPIQIRVEGCVSNSWEK